VTDAVPGLWRGADGCSMTDSMIAALKTRRRPSAETCDGRDCQTTAGVLERQVAFRITAGDVPQFLGEQRQTTDARFRFGSFAPELEVVCQEGRRSLRRGPEVIVEHCRDKHFDRHVDLPVLAPVAVAEEVPGVGEGPGAHVDLSQIS